LVVLINYQVLEGEKLMSLRLKILLILSVVVAVYVGLYSGIQRLFVMPSFLEVEQNVAVKDVKRCITALQREIHHLDLLTHDWAAWDDTCQFVEDRNSSYIKANLTLETFKNDNNNLINIYNTRGELVWGKCLDLKRRKEIQLRDLSQKVLPLKHPLLLHKTIHSSIEGIWMTEYGPMLIASRPIITSKNEGPSRGALIMGRFINDGLVETIIEQTGVDFKLLPVKKDSLPDDDRKVINQIQSDKLILIRVRDSKFLQGYALFHDIQGTPVLLLKASIPRDISIKGTTAMWFTMLSIMFAGLILLFMNWLLFERTIVKPVSKLTEYAIAIGRGEDLPALSSIERKDEIGKLAREFDSTLQKLKKEIGERKQAEEELKKSKDFLESVIESSKDGIVIFDEKGYILSVNTAMEKMSCFRKEKLIGRYRSKLLPADRDIMEKLAEKMEELFEKGSTSFETVAKTKEGKNVYVEYNDSMIKDDKGNCLAAVSIVRDITERKKMEQQLIRFEKLRSLGELAGGVAHDFNNELATILGRAQLLRKLFNLEEGKPERRKSYVDLKKGLEIIEKAALDGAETVRRIQEFSRKRDEQDDVKYFTEVDVHAAINDALEYTKLRWKDEAESKGIWISVAKILLPVPFVLGSVAELREVLTNIINNALDAMPEGGEMRVTTIQENSSVAIKIEDTGIGIPEEIKERIFDPFFTTKGPQSTGLGMSVSYGIISRHGGTIKVDSTEGKGSTFTINLPVPEKKAHQEKNGEGKPAREEFKKATILVIDDEEPVRNLLYDILEEGGHEVEVACNGSEGVELFKRKEFDLVFTDLGMPGMSGWQVAEEIKKIKRETPVALITGWKVDQESEMMKNGVDLIVNKPFQLDQVLRLVHEGMEIRKRLGNN
jgi:PAS domain S-box-containing protein